MIHFHNDPQGEESEKSGGEQFIPRNWKPQNQGSQRSQSIWKAIGISPQIQRPKDLIWCPQRTVGKAHRKNCLHVLVNPSTWAPDLEALSQTHQDLIFSSVPIWWLILCVNLSGPQTPPYLVTHYPRHAWERTSRREERLVGKVKQVKFLSHTLSKC